MALSTGTILAGRYEITAPVAVGGMGDRRITKSQSGARLVGAALNRHRHATQANGADGDGADLEEALHCAAPE